jgi:hypothetical protein
VRYVVTDPDSKDASRRHGFRSYRWAAGDPRALPVAPPVLYGSSGVVSSEHFYDKYWAQGQPKMNVDDRGDLRLSNDVLINLMRCGMTLEVQQNRLLKRIACRWIRKGYSDTQIVQMLMDLAERSEQHKSDPWTRADMVRITRSARRYLERHDEAHAGDDAVFAAFAQNLARRQS